MTVPFEIVAVDLVGPLPKGRKGVKYLFTYVCLASRWSEAQPMKLLRPRRQLIVPDVGDRYHSHFPV